MGHSDNTLTYVRHNIVKSDTGRKVVKKKHTRAHLKIYQKHSPLEWTFYFVWVCEWNFISHMKG
jgi:hypothetical protein